jgi:hypothetical protein
MRTTWHIFLLALVGAIAVTGSVLAGDKTRDLREYDLAGPYSIDRSSRHAEERPILEALIREFLWTRWEKRRLAHVSIVKYNIEGLASRTWYYVEPDKRGIWRIVIDEDIELPAVKRDSNEHLREARSCEAYSLERVGTNKSDAAGQLIAEKELREPETYRLRLKGRDGHILYEL